MRRSMLEKYCDDRRGRVFLTLSNIRQVGDALIPPSITHCPSFKPLPPPPPSPPHSKHGPLLMKLLASKHWDGEISLSQQPPAAPQRNLRRVVGVPLVEAAVAVGATIGAAAPAKTVSL